MSIKRKIAVCGLGYVGLPVAAAFARHTDVVCFDVDTLRVAALRDGHDWTGEVDDITLAMPSLTFTTDPHDLGPCDFIIVAVPTPVSQTRTPDFTMLEKACETIGAILRPGTIVVFESTVHPGATEEICGPVLERVSGLKSGVDFKLGYSPERINPGDREHALEKIVKIVSGHDDETLEIVAETYGTVITAGVFRAPSIKVAEAAKMIENTQRDINIALMNEVAKICDLMDIRTVDVIEAAATKWNFHRFTPGLVGGHCIGVDPYYLTSKAQQLGYHPEVILAGRRINDGMGDFVASRMVQMIAQAGRLGPDVRVGILGITFKENVPDIRNSRVVDLYEALGKFGLRPIIHDPHADADHTRHEYGIELSALDAFENLDALVIAVPHRDIVSSIHQIVEDRVSPGGVIVDIKSVMHPRNIKNGMRYWSL